MHQMDWQYYIDLLAQDQIQVIALPVFILAIIVEWRIDEWRQLEGRVTNLQSRLDQALNSGV